MLDLLDFSKSRNDFSQVRLELKILNCFCICWFLLTLFLSQVVHCWILFFIFCTTYEVFMTETSSFPCETAIARFDNFKALFWHNTLVLKLKSSFISLADIRRSVRTLCGSSIRPNSFERSVFLVLTYVFVFNCSSWTFLNIKCSSRNGHIPVINELLCRFSNKSWAITF